MDLDLIDLVVPDECDPTQLLTHPWAEVVGWHAEVSRDGEFRTLVCARCGESMNEGRPAEGDVPVHDPTTPPVPKA